MAPKYKILLSIAAYFGLRLFSYFFQPATPLHGASIVNTAVAVAVLALTAFLLIKKNSLGWIIVGAELLLGGSGNILSIGSVSLRTALFAVAMAVYFFGLAREKKLFVWSKPTKTTWVLILFILSAIVSACIGLLNGHRISAVLADFIPYLFLFYLLPLPGLLKDERFKETLKQILIGAIIANAIFTAATFFLYVSGLSHLQDAYYHWFRDVAQGKITLLTATFYRVVLNEHLMVVPLALYFLWNSLTTRKYLYYTVLLALAVILSLNLTRAYLLALTLGALALLSKKLFTRTVAHIAVMLLAIFSFFTVFSLIASHGQDTGWSYFGFRLASVAAPSTEDSSLSRMLLLPKILDLISASPVAGHGLGSTVTVFSPVFKTNITTTNFDWGYLEIWAEIGFFGLAIWLTVLTAVSLSLTKKRAGINRPAMAMLASLLVINATSPALFHVFGILLLVWLISANDVFAESAVSPIHNSLPPASSTEDGTQNSATTS